MCVYTEYFLNVRCFFMSIKLWAPGELYAVRSRSASVSADDGFSEAVINAINDRDSAYNSIYFNQKSFVAVSPQFEKKMRQDPELAEQTAQKIDNLTKVFGADYQNSMIVIDRRGEIKHYRTQTDEKAKKAEELEAEALKDAIKARLRRQAKLEAYFKIVQRNAIKRKLIEQENAKRPRGKSYRTNVAKLNSVAVSLVGGTVPASAADILSMLE